MKITIESTTQIVWEGETDSGIKVSCLIPRVAAHKDQDLSQFELELQEQRAPMLADVLMRLLL